jgi:Ca-activated chloride channel family protein
MSNRPILRVLLFGALTCAAAGQALNFPASTSLLTSFTAMDAIQGSRMDTNIFLINTRNEKLSGVQSPSAAVSKLDLKAPGKALLEYHKGFRLLMAKDLSGAIDHLEKAIAIYPQFVAAHNALGTAFLNQEQNEQAREEFAQAVALDDHLPNSYLNLGCAELSLKQYGGAEESLRKATEIAPLDLQLRMALAYAEFVNKDYFAVQETAREVHARKHDGAALVHYFAAGAWDAQGHLAEAREEMETLLREEPASESAEQFRLILEQIKVEQDVAVEAQLHPAQPAGFSFDTPTAPSADEAMRQAKQVLQSVRERNQIAEAEAEPASTCAECGSRVAVASTRNAPAKESHFQGPTFHAVADEVEILFAATDGGKSATGLTVSDIEVQDDSHPPKAILGFRNESELPLRLGLVIDTSNSIAERFSFEQAAATKFLKTVVTHKDDLAFVVGVNYSVLLVQDFTGDQELTARAVNQLAPGGGTALWDAVSFAAEKLARHAETQPVARVVVVISDGQDNSSGITLKRAIASVQRGGVAVYTVSTRDGSQEDSNADLGDHALRVLSDLTGGTAFVPGSMRRLQGSLAELQQVIRGRYLVSYKPASFQRDGRYRAVEIKATKDGRKLRVYARRGYYAAATQAAMADR